MSENNDQPNLFDDLKQELQELRQAIVTSWANAVVAMRNSMRRLRPLPLDYILIPIGGTLPERAEPPRTFIERQLPLPSPPLTMQLLNRRLRRIADASNVKGVVFIFRGFTIGLATLQNFRRAVQRLRATGKEVIIFTPYLDLVHYYAATAADRIVIPPNAQFDVLGLHTEVLFFKDALARAGIQADFVQISPYKTAANPFSHTDMTPEQRQQLNWLLDEQFDMVTADIATARGKSQETIKQLIDQAPLFAEATLEAGLVDHLAYEDELAYLLATKTEENEADTESEEEGNETSAEGEKPKAELVTWTRARRLMMEKPRRPTRKFIGVVSLEGAIVMGPSRQPPIDIPIPLFGGVMAGEQTIVRLLRQAERLDEMAALIFHVDSGGGSALASDLIGRQIQRLVQKKPVVVYMGNMAASGGYYVSATANHIMSQSGTLTGSIGVLAGRISVSGLYEKAHINRVSLERGERAGLYSNSTPLSAQERQIFWENIAKSYRQFKEVVAEGRAIPMETLDSICEGRVWSGRQALDHKLLDSHGDFIDALHKAAELGGLPMDDEHLITVTNLYPKSDGYIPPKPFAQIGRLLLGDDLAQWSGRPLLLMPYIFKFK